MIKSKYNINPIGYLVGILYVQIFSITLVLLIEFPIN